MVLQDPIDDLHYQCLLLRNEIRREVKALKARDATWEPRPFIPSRKSKDTP